MPIRDADRVVIVPVEAPAREQWQATAADLRGTWVDRRIWILNAIVSVGNRYRRTILGPWWLTVQTLFFVFGLALLRIGLNGGDLREAIPYVGLGYIGFQLISSGVTSGSNTFVSAGNQMATSGTPYSTYVARTNATVVIDFLHDVVVILLIALIFAIPFTLMWGWSVVAVVLIVASSVGVGLWLGPLVARFRDLGPLVSAVMRIAFFLTPIFWSVDQVEETGRGWLAWFNPFTYQLLAFRDPILGTTHPGAPIDPMVMTLILAVVNLTIGVIVFWRTRPRIPYWVAG
jgi:ABC-type polysaccharide/polyol phosphate export permease